MPDATDFRALHDEVLRAHARLRPYVRETPVVRSDALSERTGGDVWLKLESLQHTGSFKVRGAMHKLLRLAPEVRGRGVVTASSGNHGAGVAWSARALGVRAVVCVPEGASPVKVAAIRALGAEVRVFGTDGLDTEHHAREVAAHEALTYVSPYNDVDVMVAQGSVGVELAAQVGALDAVYVAVGGGGLIGGIAAYLKPLRDSVRMVGASPVHSPVMAESVRAGEIVEMVSHATLSDGTAGGVEVDTVTFPVCRALVDDWVLVDEAAIAEAMRSALTNEHMLVEGAAAVALAALSRHAGRHRGERVGVVICGANVSTEVLRRVLADA